MKSPALHRNDRSRPMRPARRRQWAGRFRPTRRLTIRALAVGTLIAALAPVTAAAGDHVPFDPGFGQGPAAR
jgi:hypothetical protein